MEADPRVLAGVNLDGAFWPAVPAGGLGGRSFMLFGKQGDHAEGDAPDTAVVDVAAGFASLAGDVRRTT